MYVAKRVAGIIVASLAIIFVVFILFVGMVGIGKWFARYQHRADARNHVKVTAIQIRNQQQRVQIAKQKAEIRYQESVGIRRAQDEIARTLTPLYIQHEAIEAQVEMSHSNNHSVIWAPTGANGVPLVSTIDVQKFGQEGK